jgi:hypothetical protein
MCAMQSLGQHRWLHAGQIMLSTILIIILVLALIGALPSWPHSRSWGYAPSGIVGTILVVLLVLALLGRV